MLPMMARTMAQSPAMLAWLGGARRRGGQRGARVAESELIALPVAQVNLSPYCLAAHSALGQMVGLSPQDVVAARRGLPPGEAMGKVRRRPPPSVWRWRPSTPAEVRDEAAAERDYRTRRRPRCRHTWLSLHHFSAARRSPTSASKSTEISSEFPSAPAERMAICTPAF